MTDRIVIIGAGIVGASIAYHLSARTDAPIVVYDRDDVASETTGKSVAQYGFYGNPVQYRMKRYGMRVYNELFAETTAEPQYTFAGLLEVASDAAEADRLHRAIEVGGDPELGKIAGTGLDADLVEYVDGGDLPATILAPFVDFDAVTGAVFRPKVGYMNTPRQLTRAFIEGAEARGVTVETGVTVTDIVTENDRVSGIETTAGPVDAATVVSAAGPWNHRIARLVGIELPMRHSLAPVLKFEPDRPFPCTAPTISLHDNPYTIYTRSLTESLIAAHPRASYDEYDRYDPDEVPNQVPADIRAEMLDVMGSFIPQFANAEPVDEWVGVRSQTPDGNPIVGWTGVEGFSIAAFNTSGIQLAPATGLIISEQLVTGEPTDYYDALSITRFDGYEDSRSA